MPRDSRISACETFARDKDVRTQIPVIDCELRTCPAKAGHHFIHDQQDSVFVAERANARQISVRRHDRSAARAGYAFDHECRDGIGALCLDNGACRLQIERGGIGMIAAERTAQRRRRRHVREFLEETFQPALSGVMPGKTGHGERRAVIGKIAGNDLRAPVLAARGEMLKRNLDRGLHTFGSAPGEMDVMEVLRQPSIAKASHQSLPLRRTPDRDDIRCRRTALGHRIGDFAPAVPDVADYGAAGSIQNPAAVIGDQPRAFTADDAQGVRRRKRPIVR